MKFWHMVALLKTFTLALLALYLTGEGMFVALRPAHAQDMTMPEVTRRVNELQAQQLDHRVTVIETLLTQYTSRLNEIEALLWKLLIGMAAIIGETVWTYVFSKARRGTT